MIIIEVYFKSLWGKSRDRLRGANRNSKLKIKKKFIEFMKICQGLKVFVVSKICSRILIMVEVRHKRILIWLRLRRVKMLNDNLNWKSLKAHVYNLLNKKNVLVLKIEWFISVIIILVSREINQIKQLVVN
jgi:hypothetical protein